MVLATDDYVKQMSIELWLEKQAMPTTSSAYVEVYNSC